MGISWKGNLPPPGLLDRLWSTFRLLENTRDYLKKDAYYENATHHVHYVIHGNYENFNKVWNEQKKRRLCHNVSKNNDLGPVHCDSLPELQWSLIPISSNPSQGSKFQGQVQENKLSARLNKILNYDKLGDIFLHKWKKPCYWCSN